MAGPLGKKLRIGRMRQRLTIQLPATGRDAFNGRVEGWTVVDGTDVKPVRAEVMPTGGRETFQNGTVQANATHRVRMRYRSGLTPKHRLMWLDTGIALNIVACPPQVGEGNIIEVWCVAQA